MQENKWSRVLAAIAYMAGLALIAAPARAQAAPPTCSSENRATLEGLNCAFLSYSTRRTDFLPRTGTFTYHLTSYFPGGTSEGVWRLTPADFRQAFLGDGPLKGVLQVQYEEQPIGRLAHQVMTRGTAWRRVAGNRFVPPGACASSPVFVEWRREGDAWVISAIGDEAFLRGVPLPSWCC